MISKVIDFSSRNKFVVIGLVVAGLFAGILSLKRIPLDAIPDLSDTQVIVHSTWNVSPDIVEDQLTYPILTALLGLPKVKDIRGLSTFGASYIYVLFEDGTDIYWARSRVMEHLSKIQSDLPKDSKTMLGPDATGLGWIYQYALRDTSGKHSLSDLKDLQDWFLRYQLQSVKGVSEVASFGGFEKQYQVQVNPHLLRAYGISLSKVMRAIRQGNSEMGARVIEFSGMEYMVRARGYAKSRKDIENIVVKVNAKGTPVYVKNVARVLEGPALRRGVGDFNGLGDTVGGIVIMRFGENTKQVVERVKEKLENLKASLPKGVEILETYDRSQLIQKAVKTLTKELFLEVLVVAMVVFFFLFHLQSAMVPIIALGSSVLISFIFMNLFGVSANIMSLGGIAIAVGTMVDAALVCVENVHKRFEQAGEKVKDLDSSSLILSAMKEVGPSSFFSLLVIALSFLPIFFLEDQEGRLFKPLAYTKTLTMLIAAFLSVTLVPVLLLLFVRGKNLMKEKQHPLSRFLFKFYPPVIDFVLKHRKKVLIGGLLLILSGLPIYFRLGVEFMPPLNEGTLLYMPTTMPGISITESQKLLQKQDRILKTFPEVLTVHGKAGRASTATDSAPLTMMETVIVLKDQKEWRKVKRWYSFLPSLLQFPFKLLTPDYMSWEELISEMNEKTRFPGLTNAWTMPVKGRLDMLSTGIRTPIGIKISGSHLKEIEKIGLKNREPIILYAQYKECFCRETG